MLNAAADWVVVGRRPQEVHASQGLKVGLYTPTILGGNSYLSWFYDREAIKDPAHTETSKGLSQAINRGPIRKSLPKYANVYVAIQSHALRAGARTHYVTADGVRNGLGRALISQGNSTRVTTKRSTPYDNTPSRSTGHQIR